MQLFGYNFEGSYKIEKGDEMLNRAAVYVITGYNENNIIDVGQSGETGTRLSNHERKPCWKKNGAVYFQVCWMPSDKYTKEDRRELEHKIRKKYTPSCGKK